MRSAFRLLFCLGLLALCSACSKSTPQLSEVQTPHRSAHLGEYIQVIPGGSIRTFQRDQNISPFGLVQMDSKTFEMQVLDVEAAEGRDLRCVGAICIYRIDKKVFLYDNRPIELEWVTSKIHGFVQIKDQFWLALAVDDTSSRLVRMQADGRTLESFALRGAVRAILSRGEDVAVVLQNPEGLVIESIQSKRTQWIERGNLGSYVGVLNESPLQIFYLDESTGVLKFASETESQTFQISIADGEAQKTMVGMDIAPFWYKGEPAALYLDAWNLQLKWTRRLANQTFEPQAIEHVGASGFYTQILEQTDQDLRLAFHSFRTGQLASERSFEDLTFARFRLP